MQLKRKIENWDHYYKIAASRPDLKDFKDFLIINANNPSANLGENKMMTKDGVKTVNQLIKELAPKKDDDLN
jgi:hypothetical protein